MKVAWILALFAATAMAIPAEAAENEVEQSMPEVESPLDDEVLLPYFPFPFPFLWNLSMLGHLDFSYNNRETENGSC